MKEIVALCKRRGFIFPASDIYGGLNGFWDYGPLGVELKNNLRDAWWNRMVKCPPLGPDGQPLQIVGLDAAIIQHPRAWEASGHVGGFNDPMVDCKETKLRYRADHLLLYYHKEKYDYVVTNSIPVGAGEQIIYDQGVLVCDQNETLPIFSFVEGSSEDDVKKRIKKFASNTVFEDYKTASFTKIHFSELIQKRILGPDAKEPGTLTEPRAFNLMFHTYVGATAGDENKTYLRPETCGPIFLNYNNVVDSARVKIPFGIAQIGKAFRNEVTPRNFIFRSREFEQMELEWFCEEDDVAEWMEFWLEERKAFWLSVGIPESMLYFNEIEQSELAHYSKRTVDIEFEFPFTSPKHGELEGVAHRGNFDLTQHAEFSKTRLDYFDQENNRRFVPHVIEPSCGLTRGVMALLSAAYTPDPNRPSGMYMNFAPSMAPKKAAILPLTAKDGQPELATQLYLELRKDFAIDLDIKQNIGKRYARQDEIGTPFCITIDQQSVEDKTVTIRHRNTMAQERIAMDQVKNFLTKELAL